MRRSMGATSSPGGRRPPVHSMPRGGRPRRASGASRKARPLAKDRLSSVPNRPLSKMASRWDQTRSSMWSVAGRAAMAARGSGNGSMPRAVPSSVTVVRSSGTGVAVPSGRRASGRSNSGQLSPVHPCAAAALTERRRGRHGRPVARCPIGSNITTTSRTGPSPSGPAAVARARRVGDPG